MTISQLVVLGNSHTEALPRDSLDGFQLVIHWLKVKEAARWGTLTMPEASALAASLAEEDALVLMYLGSLHNIIGLINHEIPYAFLQADGISSRSNGAQIIPVSTLRAFFAESLARDKVVARMKRATKARVFHVMPPPPKQIMQVDYSGKIYRGGSISDQGFAPASHRLALWRLEEALVREYVEGLGITHVVRPEHTTTSEGYLAAPYCAKDATHANKAYGKALMDRLVTEITRDSNAVAS